MNGKDRTARAAGDAVCQCCPRFDWLEIAGKIPGAGDRSPDDGNS